MCIYSIIMLYGEHCELVRVDVKINHHLYVTANASNACWERSLTDDIIGQCQHKIVITRVEAKVDFTSSKVCYKFHMFLLCTM